jgi:hypothetical protein
MHKNNQIKKSNLTELCIYTGETQICRDKNIFLVKKRTLL